MSRKYNISEDIKNIPRNCNHGYFDLVYGTPPNSVARRNAGCSMAVNVKMDNGVTHMYIPFAMFCEDSYSRKLSDTLIATLEKDLKEWVRFGRQCLIPGTYHGYGTYKELEKVSDQEDDVYTTNANFRFHEKRVFHLSWKHSDQINSKHGLAILSFYRYFYSILYKIVYERALYLFNAVEEWSELKCLMAAHYMAPSNYSGYYGMLEKNRFYQCPSNLPRLETSIRSNMMVNNQWTIQSLSMAGMHVSNRDKLAILFPEIDNFGLDNNFAARCFGVFAIYFNSDVAEDLKLEKIKLLVNLM